MANYTIDKIHYGSNTYLLKDSNALYLTNEGNLKIDGTVAADQGIFNKLIATTADIGTLDVDNLTAQNATVVGLLDVKGEMHTNTWTNANIANIGGSFYITPTVNCEIASNNTPMTITISGNANNRIIQVSNGNFITDSVEAIGGYVETKDTTYKSGKTYYYVSNGSYVEFTGSTFVDGTTYYEFNTDTYIVKWSTGSKVMLTGSVKTSNSIEYPLGTCVGVLNTPLDSTGFTIASVDSNALETIILDLGTNLQSRDIKLSMYEIGPSTVSKPIGILMTSYGVDKSTYIDIYGGVSIKDNLGYTEPNVRIGYLGGIPAYVDSIGNSHKPTGWGIYTDNGYFRGVVVADSGSIGGFSIGNNELYSQNKSQVTNPEEQGTYIGPSGFGISGGTESTTTYFTEEAILIGGLLSWNAADSSNLNINKANEIILGELGEALILSNLDFLAEADPHSGFKIKTLLSNTLLEISNHKSQIQANQNNIKSLIDELNDYYKPYINSTNNNPYYIEFKRKALNTASSVKITDTTIELSTNNQRPTTIFEGNLMKTTFGEFENLRMKAESYTNTTGYLTWIARSNGHLTLKVVK